MTTIGVVRRQRVKKLDMPLYSEVLYSSSKLLIELLLMDVHNRYKESCRQGRWSVCNEEECVNEVQ